MIFDLKNTDFVQSKAECEYLIELAKPHLVMAKVDDFKTGRNVASRFVFPGQHHLHRS